MDEYIESEFPLTDAVDNEILMHRDVHFGGNFDLMLDYYRTNGKGIQPHFEIEKILKLADLEKQMKRNLASLVLSGAEAEMIGKARNAYKKLKAIYERNPNASNPAKLMADLILSEEDSIKEIEAVVAMKEAIVPDLINLMQSEDFYDPLYPGYGLAPYLAVECLKRIGDKRAIVSLFEILGRGDFFEDDLVLEALKAIGNSAKEFLLRVVKSRPLNEDNEKAAIALLAFKEDPEVLQTCLNLLSAGDVQKDEVLSTYLILACENLTTDQKEKLAMLAKDAKFPKNLKKDVEALLKIK